MGKPRKNKETLVSEIKDELAAEIDEINAQRKHVFKLLDEAAADAANLTIQAMGFYGEEPHEFSTQKIRMEAADKILDLAGYKVKRHELTGKDGSELFKPLQIFADASHAD